MYAYALKVQTLQARTQKFSFWGGGGVGVGRTDHEAVCNLRLIFKNYVIKLCRISITVRVPVASRSKA